MTQRDELFEVFKRLGGTRFTPGTLQYNTPLVDHGGFSVWLNSRSGDGLYQFLRFGVSMPKGMEQRMTAVRMIFTHNPSNEPVRRWRAKAREIVERAPNSDGSVEVELDNVEVELSFDLVNHRAVLPLVMKQAEP